MKRLSAINSVAMKVVLGVAVVSIAMLLGASSLIKNTRQEKEPVQTELMSKESAEALRLNSLQQTKQSVPTVHNPKLDGMFLKFAESSEEVNSCNKLLSEIYVGNGTYLGSALLQKEIDIQMLYALITKNTIVVIKNNINPNLGKKINSYGEVFFKTITPNSELIDKWLDKYTQVINRNLQFDHKPTAEEVNDRLDYIAENKCNFTKDEIIEYRVYCHDFLRNKIKDKKGIQAVSDMIAFKMYIIDKLNFIKELDGAGVFGRGCFDDQHGHNMQYFYEQWMESVAPKAD